MGRHFGRRGKERKAPARPQGGASPPVELEILRWAHGGDGVAVGPAGPLEGRVVFVPGGVPGDRLLARTVEVRPRFARAEILRIEAPSPHRRTPPCEVQSTCGGCPWMVGDAAAQAASRRAILEGELKKRLGALPPRVSLRESPGELGWRQRLRMRASGGRLAFHGRASHSLVPVERCPVAVPALNAEIAARHRWLPAGFEGRVTLLAGEDGVAMHLEPDDGAPFDVGPETVSVRFGDDAHPMTARAFAQANGPVTAQVLADIGRLAGEVAVGLTTPRAIELFAGSGTLTTALWRTGYSVEAWEVAADAQAPFAATRERLGVEPARGVWHAADLLATGILTPSPSAAPDLVLVDPPRVGAAAIVPWLRRSGARRILYLACDLAAGLRDIQQVLELPAWRLGEVIAYDMFPHSGHQEVLFVLDAVTPP